MIPRHIERELGQLLAEYPVVTILGARQSGKTTLARNLLGDWDYCNLEAPETRQLAVRETITQSLAGRTRILNLYPFSIAELRDAGIVFATPWDYIYQGFLPGIYDQNQRPTQAYSNYYQTYVEREESHRTRSQIKRYLSARTAQGVEAPARVDPKYQTIIPGLCGGTLCLQ